MSLEQQAPKEDEGCGDDRDKPLKIGALSPKVEVASSSCGSLRAPAIHVAGLLGNDFHFRVWFYQRVDAH